MRAKQPACFRVLAAIASTGTFVGAMSSLPAMAAPHSTSLNRCTPDMEKIYAKTGIDKDKVSSSRAEPVVAYLRNSQSNAEFFEGYRIWLRSDLCEGSVVINLNDRCEVRDTYSRGNCKIDILRD